VAGLHIGAQLRVMIFVQFFNCFQFQ
jgi:hypothetical protein